MKSKIRKTLVCLLMTMIMVIGTAMPASAAINMGTRYANKNTTNQVYFTLKQTAGESLAKFTFQNLKTLKKTVKTTQSTLVRWNFAKDSWYKTTLEGYNIYNRKISAKTLYMANDTNVKVAQYGSTTKARITWNKLYGSTGYKVYMSTDSGRTWKLQKTTTSNSYITNSLAKYQNYYFMVLAYKKVGTATYYSAKPDRFPGIYFRTVWR